DVRLVAANEREVEAQTGKVEVDDAVDREGAVFSESRADGDAFVEAVLLRHEHARSPPRDAEAAARREPPPRMDSRASMLRSRGAGEPQGDSSLVVLPSVADGDGATLPGASPAEAAGS